MDAVRKAIAMISREYRSSSSSSPLDLNGGATGQSVGISGACVLYAGLAPPQFVLATRAPRQDASCWACAEVCAAFFVAGVVVGYTLRGRVRRLVFKVLRQLADN